MPAPRRPAGGVGTAERARLANGPGQIELRHDPLKGRGVFASRAIAAGALIEAAPVIIVPPAQRSALDQTILHDYYFLWDGQGGEICAAVALGFVSLCNHSRRPSARVRPNRADRTLDLSAITPIAAGTEITIDYNCPLWFEARD